MIQFSEIEFRNVYQRERNSGLSISRFMIDSLCFCHIGLAFLLTLTEDRLVPGLKMKTVISDVSNLPQWFSVNHNSTSGSLHKVVKWSQNYCWQTFALKAYRWIRKIWHLLAGHKYSLNPYVLHLWVHIDRGNNNNVQNQFVILFYLFWLIFYCFVFSSFYHC